MVAFFPVIFIYLVQYRGINQEQDFLAVRVECHEVSGHSGH